MKKDIRAKEDEITIKKHQLKSEVQSLGLQNEYPSTETDVSLNRVQ